MKRLIVALLMAIGVIALADDAPQAQQDSEKPAAKAAESQPASEEFPSPAELVKKMKELEQKRASLSKVAYFNLTLPLEEKPADFSLFGEDASLTLRSLLERLRAAEQDHDVKAILITLGAESNLNFSQAQEVRDVLAAAVKAGKPVFVYADSYDTPGYTLATGANHICMLEGGEIEIPGVGMELTFLKGLFDKVGVKADYVQIGEYKGADEEYTRTGASEELAGELTKLTDALYTQIVQGIVSHRHLQTDEVQKLIDQTIVTGDEAKNRGFVDVLTDQDGMRPLLTKELGNDIDLVNDYGAPPRQAVDLSSPFGLLSLLTRRSEAPSDKPAVAIIYAAGVITDGEGGQGMFQDSGVGSETLRRAFRVASRDPNIKAVVVRIDSPGGSALASEVMWQAARHCAEKKPVIVSVGSMAASGGYYLASAGDKIYADPSAIVGSIGVVGGKFVIKDLFDKLGINTESFSKGKNAGLFSMNEPWSDRQRTMVTNWMRQTYIQFTERVTKMRGEKIKDIDKIARGRIFLAGQAKALGMVDEIGGVEDAISYAAKKGGVQPGQYDVRILPQPKTLGDILTGNGAEVASAIKPKIEFKDPIIQALSPALRKTLGHQLRIIQLLQDRPVALVAPFDVTVK